jgi:hypothetical protein
VIFPTGSSMRSADGTNAPMEKSAIVRCSPTSHVLPRRELLSTAAKRSKFCSPRASVGQLDRCDVRPAAVSEQARNRHPKEQIELRQPGLTAHRWFTIFRRPLSLLDKNSLICEDLRVQCHNPGVE